MQYRYVAYTRSEGVVSGTLEAENPEYARSEVARMGYRPIRISHARKLPGLATLRSSLSSPKVGTGEVVLFARQLATMLSSGGSILRALEMLHEESQGGGMKRTLEAVRKAVDEGSSLSVAMREHPKVFSVLFVSVVEVGEHTGRIGTALEQLADILEQEHEAKQKAMRMMMYPAAIIGLSFVTLGVLMSVALPPLLKVFDQMGADIPLMTRMGVGAMAWIRTNVSTIFFSIIAFLAIYSILRRSPRSREWVDNVLIRMPLMGPFIVAGELARFSRTNAMLLDSGVTLSTSLALSIQSSKNLAMQRAFRDGEESLLGGHGLVTALKKHSILPSLFVELLTIGEETNSIQRTLEDAADNYQKQLERRLNNLLAVLEPASTAIVGGIVGFIAFSMFVPIYSGLEAL